MYCPLDTRKPCPCKLKPTETYLGESMGEYYVMDGFGNMFKRMVKFTPNSFKPKNILKAFTNTTIGVATGGLIYAAPAAIRKQVFKLGETIVPVVAGAAVAVAAGPAVMGILGPKLSSAASMLGKGLSSVGGSLFQKLLSLPQSQQSAVAQEVTPEDIVYAEQNNGQFPPRFESILQREQRVAWDYPQPPSAPNYAHFASSSLYPGLQQARAEQGLPKQEEAPSEGLTPAATIGIAVGGSALLLLLLRK